MRCSNNISLEVIAAIVGAVAAVAALAWAIFAWRHDQKKNALEATKAADYRRREAEAAESRRREEAAQREAEQRTHLKVDLAAEYETTGK
jgi:hypothetical protein